MIMQSRFPARLNDRTLVAEEMMVWFESKNVPKDVFWNLLL
jgi:hypothetical protein